MKKIFLSSFILFSINISSFGDENIIKCFNLIATLNKTYAAKATKYLKNTLEQQVLSEDQKAVLKECIEIGEFILSSIQKKKEKGPALNKKYKIFKDCYICKGTRIADKKAKCRICKALGKCRRCKGRNSGGGAVGEAYFLPCTPCEGTGICQTCKGDKYLETDCDKCYLTDGTLDSQKTKVLLMKLRDSYITLPEMKIVPMLKPIPQALKNFSAPYPKIHTRRSIYNGFFIEESGSLAIVFRALDIFNPLTVKCIYNGKQLEVDKIAYSPSYKCYKMILKHQIRGVKINRLGELNSQNKGSLFFPLGEEKGYEEFENISMINPDDLSRAFILVQDNKVSCILGSEDVVDRKNIKTQWFKKYLPVKKIVKPIFLKNDFLKSFVFLGREELQKDVLALNTYLLYEYSIIERTQRKITLTEHDMPSAILRSFEKKFSGGKFKTVWAKEVAKKLSDTASQLASISF